MAQKKTVTSKTKPGAKASAKSVKTPLKSKSAKVSPATKSSPAAKAKAAVAAKKQVSKSEVKGAKVKVAVKAAAKPTTKAVKPAAKAAPATARKTASTAKVAARKPQVVARAADKAPVKAKATPAAGKALVGKPVGGKPVSGKPAAKAPAPQPPIATKPKAAAPVVGRPVNVPPAATIAVGRAPLPRAAGKVVPAAVTPSASQSQKVSAPVTAAAGSQTVSAPKDVAQKAAQARDEKKPVSQRHGFKTNEFIVYPAHGVGRIVGIEEQEIAGMSLELFVITFEKDKMTLRVPTAKLASVGMRKLAEENTVKKALEILKGRARIKRTMWSRRAQEYEAKINSGDLVSIAEVVRDLYRSESQPEQSYSERQLYEAALDRMARELAAVERLDDRGAVQRITDVLSKSAKSRRAAEDATGGDDDGADEVKAA
ncbi:MAG: CarD family transcriptional regulator [Hyphomicrobiaceae bacterium]